MGEKKIKLQIQLPAGSALHEHFASHDGNWADEGRRLMRLGKQVGSLERELARLFRENLSSVTMSPASSAPDGAEDASAAAAADETIGGLFG